MDLEGAFRKSTVWFNLEIAKKVGAKNIRNTLPQAAGAIWIFQNRDLIFNFGPFKITPTQQIELL